MTEYPYIVSEKIKDTNGVYQIRYIRKSVYSAGSFLTYHTANKELAMKFNSLKMARRVASQIRGIVTDKKGKAVCNFTFALPSKVTSSYEVSDLIFNPPYTIINWMDDVKTVSRCKDDEEFDEYIGFTACVAKRVFGGHNQYKRIIESANRVQEKGGKK